MSNERKVNGLEDLFDGIKFHSAAVDMRILALTSLLPEKGIITEKEVQDAYYKSLRAVKASSELTGDKKNQFEEYLKDFLQIRE